MKRSSIKLYICMAGLVLFSVCTYAQNASDVIAGRLKKEIIENHLFSQVTSINNDYLSKAGEYLNHINPNGSWTDIDYKDTDNDWSPLVHMERLLVLSYAYNNPSDPLYQSTKALNTIQHGLDYWFSVKPVCVNWFKNDITRPIHFSTIGVLMQGKIKPSTLANILDVLPVAPIRSTTDRVRSAYCVLHRGVIQKDPNLIRTAINGVAATYIQTTGDGIQPDWSYHYHGPLLYNSGYGLDLLNFTLTILPLVKDTELDFTLAQKQLLDTFMFNGIARVTYGNQLDYSTMGRQIASTSRYIDGFVKHLEFMKSIFPDKTAIYQDLIDGIVNKQPQNIAGNFYHWNSDFVVHRSMEYYTSVHMCSARTIGMECLNFENLKGMWEPFGVNYILHKGNEYQGIFNVLNWHRLPGTTAPDTLKLSSSGITQKTDFVGGVSDGTVGSAVMNLDYFNTVAKKAWFFFDKEWVALGSAIASSDSHEVATTINQCLLKSDVVTDKGTLQKGSHAIVSPQWILQDEIGYYFPEQENVQIKAGTQTGSHSQIYAFGSKEQEQKEVFLLTIPHGIRPNNATYSYVVIPGVKANDMQQYSKNPDVKILSNTDDIKAVAKPAQNILQVIFYKAGSFTTDNMTITVDHPCLLMVNKAALWVADPTTNLTTLTVTIEKDGKKGTQTIALPQGETKGKSVKVSSPVLSGVYATNTFLREEDLPWDELGGGVKRQILGYDPHLMIVKVAFEKGSIGTPHTHVHTQSTYVASGKFQVEVNGKKRILTAGDGFFVPSGVMHGVICLEKGVLIDSFSPAREDFVKNK